MPTDLPPPLSFKTGCRQSISSDAEWLNANLGPFTTVANYSDLKALNVSGVKYLPSVMFLFREPLTGTGTCVWCWAESTALTVMCYFLGVFGHLSWQLWKPCHLIKKQSCCLIQPPVLLKMWPWWRRCWAASYNPQMRSSLRNSLKNLWRSAKRWVVSSFAFFSFWLTWLSWMA